RVNDRQLLHGAALAELIDEGGLIALQRISDVHDYAYEVEKGARKLGVLFKYSTATKSPWRFGFSSLEELALKEMEQRFHRGATFVAFICGRDGVCCVSLAGLADVLGVGTWAGLAMSISRPRDSGYRVRGPGKALLRKVIPKSAWPRVLWDDQAMCSLEIVSDDHE
ncbi:hypothetical protein, partial [Archangium violaceum]|uniref:hypothetical protein n=1 Tax=Archangium violaceum TaxID=83451 RepID=UPI001F184084